MEGLNSLLEPHGSEQRKDEFLDKIPNFWSNFDYSQQLLIMQYNEKFNTSHEMFFVAHNTLCWLQYKCKVRHKDCQGQVFGPKDG